MTRLAGDIAVMLGVLGLSKGDGRILDAIALVDLPSEADAFLRDDGTTADYLVVRPAGTELRFIDGVLESVLIRTQVEEGYGSYPRPDALIEGLSATASRAEVRDALGEPEASGPAWDRFEVDGGFVHCKFVDGAVGRVSVMLTTP